MAKLHIRHGRLACQDLWWSSLPAIHIHQGREQTKPSLLVRTVAVFFTRRDIRSTPGCSCSMCGTKCRAPFDRCPRGGGVRSACDAMLGSTTALLDATTAWRDCHT